MHCEKLEMMTDFHLKAPSNKRDSVGKNVSEDRPPRILDLKGLYHELKRGTN